MKKIGLLAVLSMVGMIWAAGCGGGTPNCDALTKAVDDCCAKDSADAAQCDALKASAKASTDLASQLGTDCSSSAFTCPFQ